MAKCDLCEVCGDMAYWSDHCGCLVCDECDHHNGLCRCYCGWETSGGGRGIEELLERGEVIDPYE